MPELPEVETVRRHLEPLICRKRIVSAHLPENYQKTFSGITAAECTRRIKDQSIDLLSRRGKYLILELSSGFLTFHLRMTGRIFQSVPSESDWKYITAWFLLSDGSGLYFKDVRKFGRIVVSDSMEWLEEKLGIEPFSEELTPEYLQASFSTRKRSVKGALLDQSIIAGLGNIYADEVLFLSGLHPETPCGSVTGKQCTLLCKAIVKTLQTAIDLNGTTFQSFYFGEEETSGEFLSQLNVFGRTGLGCRVCKTPIVKTRVVQRGTHYCPRCQPN
jgi:formamidopyrimidine-DNA glycosylase